MRVAARENICSSLSLILYARWISFSLCSLCLRYFYRPQKEYICQLAPKLEIKLEFNNVKINSRAIFLRNFASLSKINEKTFLDYFYGIVIVFFSFSVASNHQLDLSLNRLSHSMTFVLVNSSRHGFCGNFFA